MKNKQKALSVNEKKMLLDTLQQRFNQHKYEHQGISWDSVILKLESHPEKLWSLHQMEQTGGEPDLVEYDKKTKEFIFYDCSTESPTGRRSLCYDRKALDSRKENKPKASAIEVAESMGIEILDEARYRKLQSLGHFDKKTSSWILTPKKIRDLGGALFCDYRYDTVFVYHNGAESYYAARGFRGYLKL
ncbi:MAG: hypothetical protein K0R26_2781 [Bacteroidota bacterium]|jgi:hypothetical protein|nr:hypothetical protein [Bacteroidota bacterium]